MTDVHLNHPTVRQLLSSEALSESQIISGADGLDRLIEQITVSVSAPVRRNSFLLCKAEALLSAENLNLEDLAAVALMRPAGEFAVRNEATGSAGALSGGGSTDITYKRVSKLCEEAGVPLVVVPIYTDSAQLIEDVRTSFLRAVRLGTISLHNRFLHTMLNQGIQAVVDECSEILNRPVVVETSEFKVLAGRNMGATPSSQQRTLSDESSAQFKKFTAGSASGGASSPVLLPVRIGRRLVLPIVLHDSVVGYIAVMVRPTDDIDYMTQYLHAAAIATSIDFSQRSRDGSIFSVTQKSLLKDLLSGASLSASDLERLERHYGFDLCDNLLIVAIQAVEPEGTPDHKRQNLFPEDGIATAEVEGARVFIIPISSKQMGDWQQEVSNLIDKIRSFGFSRTKMRLQAGVARLVETVSDLPDAYKEARQALIIGSMIHGDNEFVTAYGDLGIRRLIYLVIDHPELVRFYQETLAPLEAYDEEWESELVPTLRVYIEQGANLNSAARALFIHRHTLRYRLEQIIDILKVDIDSQTVLLNLQIAFLIREMQGHSRGSLPS